MKPRILLPGFAAMLLCIGCGSIYEGDCPADLRTTIAPRDTTIAVGQTFTVQFRVLGCAGTQPLADEIRFTTNNPAVAAVSSTSGLVTAVTPGTTTVRAMAQYYHISGDVTVRVQ